MAHFADCLKSVTLMTTCCGRFTCNIHGAGLETCIRDARYSQLRSSAYAAAKVIVREHERLNLSKCDLLGLRNTVHERAEQDPALKSEIDLIVQSL